MKRLLYVDGLRGIAALIVCANHLLGRTDLHWLGNRGYLGVAIFFVLSGFVIAMVVGNSKISAGYLGRFALRRSLRLDPPYWASIAVAIGLMLLAERMGVDKDLPSAPDILLNMFYLQDLAGAQSIADVYWTLCLEVQFYLTLILILWARVPRILLSALLGWSLLEHASVVNVAPRGLFVPYWFGFSAGVLAYWTSVGRTKPLVLGVALLAIGAFSIGAHGDWNVVTVLTAGSLYAAHRWKRMQSWLSQAPFQFFGRISYSLYLFHGLIGWSTQSFAMGRTNQWVALAIGFTASVLSAWGAYLLLERPAIWLSHRVSTKQSTLVTFPRVESC